VKAFKGKTPQLMDPLLCSYCLTLA
jgi:hypothetical protein